MALIIQEIRFQRIQKKLKKPFITSLQTVEKRESIVVTVESHNGLKGYGECVAFSTPWYTEETVESCAFVMEKVLRPLLQQKKLNGPREVDDIFSAVKGNSMAKAAIEMAIWDLFAKNEKLPLWRYVGGTSEPIPAGVVVAAGSGEMQSEIDRAAASGYSRIKIKISRDSDVAKLKEAIDRYPGIIFFADANGGFDNGSFDRLMEFDGIGLRLIEQPFGEEQWELHARAKQSMKTSICLDESIGSARDVEKMIEMRAGDIIALKMGRLGGWAETLKIVELCRRNNIGMWVGGMIEFGVSKAHNLALASLPDIGLPGDFSDSRHFWNEDIIQPEIEVKAGKISLRNQAGIGFDVNMEKAGL